MSKILSLLMFFAGLIFATNANVNPCQVGTRDCDCLNPFFVTKPTRIQECYPLAKYQYQVQQNYKRIYSQLTCQNIAQGCNLSKYLEVVNGMRSRTEDIINAFYSSTDEQCESAILGAYDKFAQYRTTPFNTFTRCSFTNYSPQCAQIIMGVRPLVYVSAENLMTSFVSCCKLRLQSPGRTSTLLELFIELTMVLAPSTDCNCINIDRRPIPTSDRECFSPEYIAKLRNFINVNFDKIDKLYGENKSPDCPDYSNLEQNIKDFRAMGIEMTKILEKSDPKFADINALNAQYTTLKQTYNPNVRNYIVDNTKNCYFRVRRARQYPLSIVDAVVAAVTKCVKYRDAANGIC